MKDKMNIILKWAVIGNLVHLLVAGLNTLINKESTGLMLLMTVLTLLVWTYIGFKLGGEVVKGKETDFLLFGFLCILPMLLFNLSAQALQGTVEGLTTIQNYNLFYFLGAPVLFWNNPFYSIMNLFPESNIYIQMNINLMLVVLFSFLGAYIGKGFRIQQLRKSKKKQLN